jgi:hypothetical protein
MHYFVRHVRGTTLRLLLTVPPGIVLLLHPNYIFDAYLHPNAIAICSALLSWWCLFRVIGFAVGHGQGVQESSFGRTAFYFIAPVTVRYNNGDSKQRPQLQYENGRQLLVSLAMKAACFACIVNLLVRLPIVHELPLLELLCNSGLVYCAASVLMDGPGSAVSLLFGVCMQTHFNEPYLATSLADFWGHRWNLMAGGILRESVYSPLMILYTRWHAGKNTRNAKALDQQSSTTPSSHNGHQHGPERIVVTVSVAIPKWWRCVAVQSTFLVSGAMHELIMYYLLGELTWYWFAFFVVHGIALSFESLAKKFAPNLVAKMPTWLCRIITLSFFLCTLDRIFFVPTRFKQLDRRLLAEYLSVG